MIIDRAFVARFFITCQERIALFAKTEFLEPAIMQANETTKEI